MLCIEITCILSYHYFSFVFLLPAKIREYHRRHPAARVVDANEDYEAMLKEEPVIEFTGEVSLSNLCHLMIILP